MYNVYMYVYVEVPKYKYILFYYIVEGTKKMNFYMNFL